MFFGPTTNYPFELRLGPNLELGNCLKSIGNGSTTAGQRPEEFNELILVDFSSQRSPTFSARLAVKLKQ